METRANLTRETLLQVGENLSRAKKFIGFILAGGVATILNYSIFLGLYSLDINYLIASSLGYVSGIGVSFAINRFTVFRQSPGPVGQFLKYFLVYLMALALQLALLELGVRLGITPYFANAIALIFVVIINFFVVQRFVFKEGKSRVGSGRSVS